MLHIELKIKSCLDDLLNKNYLSKDDKKYLIACGTKPDIMYGLDKIHKGITVHDPVPPFLFIFKAIAFNYNFTKDFCINT